MSVRQRHSSTSPGTHHRTLQVDFAGSPLSISVCLSGRRCCIISRRVDSLSLCSMISVCFLYRKSLCTRYSPSSERRSEIGRVVVWLPSRLRTRTRARGCCWMNRRHDDLNKVALDRNLLPDRLLAPRASSNRGDTISKRSSH